MRRIYWVCRSFRRASILQLGGLHDIHKVFRSLRGYIQALILGIQLSIATEINAI